MPHHIRLLDNGWPAWPQVDEDLIRDLETTVRSTRWAISGYTTDLPTREQCFARRFAQFNGVAHCTPVTNGSAALLLALDALDIGPGDEVIVPALTWLATATAVLNAGAKPVLADVSPTTLCIDPQSIEAAITERTKAIIVVHLYGSMADLDAIEQLAAEAGVALVEDCAQTIGARWRGLQAGTIGRLGTFSFQQGKLLTAGEGGAVITRDAELHRRLEQLRSDSRQFIHAAPLPPGNMELVELGEVQGSNHCLSELQASILIGQLDHIEALNQRRSEGVELLARELAEIPAVTPQASPEGVSLQTYYGYCLLLDGIDGRAKLEELCRRLRQELQIGDFFLHPVYVPVHKNRLFCPWTKRRHAMHGDESSWRNQSHPCSENVASRALVLHHSMLLASEERLTGFARSLGRLLG